MVALFDDFAVIDDDNAISVADCTQPCGRLTKLVRPYKAQEGLWMRSFGARIDTCGRLVENEDAGYRLDGARDGQKLALAPG